MALISVVFPAPFGPTTHTSSPSPMMSDAFHSAGAEPWFTRRSRTSSMCYAEIRRGNVAPSHHVGRGAFRKHTSLVEHDDAIRKRGHDTHHVLDEDDRRPAFANARDELDRLVDLGGGEAR